MPKINQRVIQSISTGPQPSEPLPKDVIIGSTTGLSSTQYIQRLRYVYQWPNRQDRNLDRIKLYQGTITPLPSQIQFYRNRARKVIAIFEKGHDIEPPFLEDSQIPHATIITTREFLCSIPASAPQTSSDRPASTIGTKRRREDDSRDGSFKRSKSASFASPAIAFALGVAVGVFNSNILSRVCDIYT